MWVVDPPTHAVSTGFGVATSSSPSKVDGPPQCHLYVNGRRYHLNHIFAPAMCPSSTSLHPQRPCSDVTVPLLVHRFVNGVPMLDTNTSSACALVAGVSKAGWRGLGLKISASRVLHSEGRLRFVLTEAPTPLKVIVCRGSGRYHLCVLFGNPAIARIATVAVSAYVFYKFRVRR